LSETIAGWTHESTDPLFEGSLFSAATHILYPIARFPATDDGIARFSSAVGLSTQVANTPLKEVFEKPVIGDCTSPQEVSAGTIALVERIQEYFSYIDNVVAEVDSLVTHLKAVATDASLVPKGIEQFADGLSSDNPVDAATVIEAWKDTGSSAGAYILAVVGLTNAAKLSSGT
jgi:hypothetical protein